MIEVVRRTFAQHRGDAAERAALGFLERNGLRLVQRNFRCKLGEIDLIMRDGVALVFVEVRFRQRHSRFGDGASSVTWRKQQRLIRAAQFYLQRRGHTDVPCRFDVLSAQGDPGGSTGSNPSEIQFDWIKNAFDTF